MAQETQLPETTLKITKELSAPVDKVFSAWADAQQMVQWMGPGEVSCQEVQSDFKVGGQYKIYMVDNDGDHVAVGEFQEIIPNEKISFTWGWQGGDVQDTLVTLDFIAEGEKTILSLTHENFPTKTSAEKHTMGWNGCLSKLEKFVE